MTKAEAIGYMTSALILVGVSLLLGIKYETAFQHCDML